MSDDKISSPCLFFSDKSDVYFLMSFHFERYLSPEKLVTTKERYIIHNATYSTLGKHSLTWCSNCSFYNQFSLLPTFFLLKIV